MIPSVQAKNMLFFFLKKNALILPMGRISPGKFVIFPDKKKIEIVKNFNQSL